MSELDFVKIVADNGMGFVSFLVIIFGLYKAGQFLEKLTENHLNHFQETMDKILEVVTDIKDDMKKGG